MLRAGDVQVTYRCSKCGAEDKPTFGANEPPPLAINCWKCHSGKNINDPLQMASQKIGMLPVSKVVFDETVEMMSAELAGTQTGPVAVE